MGKTPGSWLAAAGPRRAIAWSQRNGLFFALALLAGFFTWWTENFLTRANITVIFLQVSVVGIIAIPGAMLVLSGYVDLAVGSVAVMTSVLFGTMMSAHFSMPVAVLLSLAGGAATGFLSGVLIAYLDFSPIIVTLGGLAGIRGVAELVSQGNTEFGFGPAFAKLGHGSLAGLPTPVWLFGATVLVGVYVWYGLPYGRRMTAIGADRAVAHTVGIAVKRTVVTLYVASGAASALGGLILTAQLDGSSLSIGQGLELEVLTAILLGGVSFTGGRGALFGVVMGILFIGVLSNGLVVINVSPFVENVAVGAALVLAAGLDVLYRRLERIPIVDRRDSEEPAK